MKKRWISTAAAAAIITCSLALCVNASDEVTAEKLYNSWLDKMETAESISSSEKMDMEIDISILGQHMAIDMLCDFDSRSAGSNSHLKGNVQMKAVSPDGEENENVAMEMYAVPAADGSGYDVYQNNGEGWEHTTSESQDNGLSPESMMHMDNLTLSEETKTISLDDGTYECYELTGTVPFSNMNNTLQMTGGDVTESFGVGSLDDADADIPGKMYFDTETGDLVMLELDGSDAVREMFLQSMKEEASIPQIPGIFELDIPAFTVVIDSISLNTVDEITVPDDVISSAVESDS